MKNRRNRLTLGRGSVVALVLLTVAIAFTTTYRSEDEASASGKPKFDPVAYAAKTYEAKVVPAIKKNANDITTLHKAIAADPEAAGKRYGHQSGTGPASYAVTLTGTAGPARSGLMPVTVPGLDKSARVSVQIGPAINGSALRDAAGFITFGQFTNQVEYADAATALNTEMKAKVLKSFDAAAAEGKKVTVTGAMTPLTADTLTITPISIEAAS
ncbi:DUF2291 domain-containing protein [Streptomyces sp. MA15]|uniref:DUF2291 family protein n=1 Tax=Streptomyces sp. MA15 TaxID=3055061 RepID=UPI0025B08484|nr:DUF2291 domain-containing protein [Streptomyces sp. MA15]MDN3270169.1 DUF2291 domain-containing protein [Streptomyces sp. MA15]